MRRRTFCPSPWRRAAGGGRIATAANKISSPPVEEALFAPYNRNRFEMRD